MPHPPLRIKAKPAWLLASLLSAWPAAAQTALEPAQGGTDFTRQGEYFGAVAPGDSLGIQVVALGSGKFRAVFLPGGLPGRGWNGKDRIDAATSTLRGDSVSFSAGGYSAIVAPDGQSIAGMTDKNATFSFAKIMRASPSEGLKPPAGDTALFDGTQQSLSNWKEATASIDPRGLFLPQGVSEATGAVTKQTFQSFTLHLEFREPFMPSASGQQRGNSGVYLQGRDEVQILDSFGNDLDHQTDTLQPKRECGAFFEYARASVNMSFPPLSWQTYDIEFNAARWSEDGKTRLQPADATVWWNGVKVQDHTSLPNPTLLGAPVSPDPGPLLFQAHGDPVYYRNIWVTQGTSALRPERAAPRRRGSASGPVRFILADGKTFTADPDRAKARPPAFGFYLSDPNGSEANPHPGEFDAF